LAGVSIGSGSPQFMHGLGIGSGSALRIPDTQHVFLTAGGTPLFRLHFAVPPRCTGFMNEKALHFVSLMQKV